MKIARKKVKALAAHWVKDDRTIRRWLKINHPMLTHPDSIKIMKSN